MRLLERLDHPAVTEAGVDRLFELDRPELALDVPGRFARPNLLDHVDRFDHHRVAIGRERPEHLHVATQPARPDAHQPAAARKIVEHGGISPDFKRGYMRQIGADGAMIARPRLWEKTGESGRARE